MKKLLLLPPLIIVFLAGVYLFFPAFTFGLLVKAERGMSGLEQHSIEADGLRFEYLQGGEGEPLVVLHGFGGNKDNWTRIAPYLTARFRVIVPDLTGFGESSRAVDNDYRIARQAERLYVFLRALGIDSFHLGGSSMGGYIAGDYAAKHPEQILSLWLISPSGVAAAKPSELAQLLASGKPNPLIPETVEDYDRLLDFVFTDQPFIPEAIKAVFVDEAIGYQALHDEIYTQLEEGDAIPPLEVLLQSFPKPVFILWGANDRVLHVSGAEVLAEAIPDSQLQVLDNTGHLPMLERAKLSAEYFLGFVDGRTLTH